MARQEKLKSGFVIRLSSETVQKLADEDEQAKKLDERTLNCENFESEDKKDTSVDILSQTMPTDNKKKIHVKPDSLIEDKTLDKDKEHQEKETINSENKNESKDNSSSQINTSWGEYAPYITYEDEQAIYTDPSTHQTYKWNQTNNAWDPNSDKVTGREYSYENDTHIYTEADGSKFFWDAVKKAWIPKVDDDFLAYYQMSYGFVDNTTKDESDVEKEKKDKADEKTPSQAGVKRKSEPQWFEPSKEDTTKVYVSNLPLDLTEEEFVNFMQKCGLVERDLATHKMKIKLYMDKDQNCFKGDALCTYIKKESVELALNLLDGSDLKGNKVKVERAHFQLKGEYNPALKPKKKKKKEIEKLKKIQQKLFDWRPEKFIGERSKHEKVVIVKNLFHPTDFDKEVQLILDYQQDLREEASKSGEVKKVVIYDRHPEGVAQITMKEPEMADAVVELINGRWFGKRQITAEIWDGRTKYRIAETDADLSKRINNWDKFLDDKEGKSETKVSQDGLVKEPDKPEIMVEDNKEADE